MNEALIEFMVFFFLDHTILLIRKGNDLDVKKLDCLQELRFWVDHASHHFSSPVDKPYTHLLKQHPCFTLSPGCCWGLQQVGSGANERKGWFCCELGNLHLF